MNPAKIWKEKVDDLFGEKSELHLERGPSRPTILIATIDPDIRAGLTQLFEMFSVNTIWAQGVEVAKQLMSQQRISACLCGLWLQDGTYRELVRHIRRGRTEIPVIIVSAPSSPSEYRDYLSAMNLGALDFLEHPYQRSELERMLWSAMGDRLRPLNQEQSSIKPSLPATEAA